MGVTRAVTRGRVLPSTANTSPPEDHPAGAPAVAPSECGGSECGVVEFTRDEVESLLNERMKGKSKTDFKGRCELMTKYIGRLRSCIKWFVDVEEGHLLELQELRKALEEAERKCLQLEADIKKRESEYDAAIRELKSENASLVQKFQNEEADKLAALESYRKEKEAREAVEKARNALTEALGKAEKEAENADQQIKSMQDINRRLQEYNTSLQQYNSRLQNDAAAHNEAIARLQKEKSSMMEALSNIRSHSTLIQEQLNSSRDALRDALAEKEDMKSRLEELKEENRQVKEDRNIQFAQNQSVTAEFERFKDSTRKLTADLETVTKSSLDFEVTCSSQKEQILMLQSQLESANSKLQMADSSVVQTRVEFEEQRKLIQDLKARLADAEYQIAEGEKLRKKLHNTILELKGNIRVFCRVRPLLDKEESTVISYPTSTDNLGRGVELTHTGKKYSFTFDKVFNHDASQEDVFVEISQLVQSALDGYKVCIFAYGQTGSGKTYTMMGKQDAPELKGLIPRSVEQIFETSRGLLSQGWRYKMQASMLEIYNESIRDLLASNRGSDPNPPTGKQYTIKHDQNGNTHVSDLTIVDVCSTKEVSYLLNQAAQSRSVGRTQMNEQSSRSHFVFMLRIYGTNESTEQNVQGVLNLIDLAGSERLDKSGATGDRLKETQHINKSLLSLSDVISSIAKKEDHIPFRNSKLTYLLQPCLGGESKTLMFVNISPEASSTGESKCSLQFAAKVNSCEIGVPRRQTQLRAADS